ncbi:aspartate aminotransferase [Clavibacter sepedonicus]|uniref:cysteine-S-conjugate beta-lyase n=2 Tax=Microbacteriaceae TaxID=85023 RepID=B0RBS1_CLASE|nr:aspartate aminotransferase [Clavibacter sepedonicus]OQJ53788.1 aspartate aminotransferase [Clavibacter sepedonicus]CAQ00472.1 putative aminotransferase [Clavibacter sepedonicus]
MAAMVEVTTAPIDEIRGQRTSIKWTRFPADVLPLFVAEMDYAIAEPVVEELVRRVRASDVGYLDGPGPLAPAFARFARERWGWIVDESRVRIATDVSVGIVETLRLAVPRGGRVVVTPPVYPPFFELVEEAGARVEEVPLLVSDGRASLDLTGLERAFASGVDAFLLCNPHNPMGIVHDARTLAAVARLAARHDVLVISDEVHAPLTLPGATFTPFAPLAESLGASSVCVTSASKGWNLAGAKCSLVIAGDPRTHALLDGLVEEVACRTSILGLHANVAAFSCTDWLDDAIARIVANDRLLASLLAEHLPGVVHHRPAAGYLAWLDLRPLGLGADPAAVLLERARVALNAGHCYGTGGAGHARLNLACDPDVLREAVRRIAAAVGAAAASTPVAAPAPAATH